MSAVTSRTALALRDTDWVNYHPVPPRVDPGAVDRRRRAWEAAKAAAGLLRDKYGAARIAVFGSLVHPSEFTRRSDIDLAVWGIPREMFYRAVADVTGMSAEFEFDIIDPETAAPHVRGAIAVEGAPL